MSIAAQQFQHIDNLFAVVSKAAGLNTPLTPAEIEHRDDLTEFFEARAERTDENDHVLIRVDAVVDLILDNEELAALIEPVRSVTPRKEQ